VVHARARPRGLIPEDCSFSAVFHTISLEPFILLRRYRRSWRRCSGGGWRIWAVEARRISTCLLPLPHTHVCVRIIRALTSRVVAASARRIRPGRLRPRSSGVVATNVHRTRPGRLRTRGASRGELRLEVRREQRLQGFVQLLARGPALLRELRPRELRDARRVPRRRPRA